MARGGRDEDGPRARPAAPGAEEAPADEAGAPLARAMVAADLDRAGRGQLVYVGADGEVRDPRGVRRRQALQVVAFGGVTAAGVGVLVAAI